MEVGNALFSGFKEPDKCADVFEVLACGGAGGGGNDGADEDEEGCKEVAEDTPAIGS